MGHVRNSTQSQRKAEIWRSELQASDGEVDVHDLHKALKPDQDLLRDGKTDRTKIWLILP